MTTWNVVGTTEHVALGELQQDGGVDGHMNTGEMSYTDNSQNSVDQSAALDHWIEAFEHALVHNDNNVEAAVAAIADQGCPDGEAVAEMWIHQQENPDTTEDLSEIPPAEDPSMTPAPQDVAQAQQPLASTHTAASVAEFVNYLEQGSSPDALYAGFDSRVYPLIEEAIKQFQGGGQQAPAAAQPGRAPAPPYDPSALNAEVNQSVQDMRGINQQRGAAFDAEPVDGGGVLTDPGIDSFDTYNQVQEDPTQVGKEWLHECFDDEEGAAEAIEALSPEETQAKVNQFFDGGWPEFLKTMELQPLDDDWERGYEEANGFHGEPEGVESDLERAMRDDGSTMTAKTADLAGSGPKRDKANEIYKAIRRDHPEKDKSSAAAIANDSANKLFEKKDDNDSDEKKYKKEEKSSDSDKSSDDDNIDDDKDGDEKPAFLKKKDSRASYQGLNGRIAAIYTDTWGDKMVLLSTEHGDLTVPAAEVEAPVGEEAPAADPVGEINEFLSIIDPAGHVPASFHARIHNLGQVVAAGRKVILSGEASLADQMALDEIILKSSAEIVELTKLAEEYVSEGDLAYAEDLPQYEMGGGGVMEQADVGHQSDGGWLDETYHEMMADAQATDFDAIVSEEPALLVSDMPDAVLADQGAAENIATNFISAKTHSIPENIRTEIHTAFVANVEQARREALAQRKIAMKRTAAALPEADGPAEGLFG